MGMPIVVDVRDDVDARRPSTRSSTGSAGSTDLQHLQARQRDQPARPRRPGGSRTRSPTCAPCSTAARSCATRRAATSTPAPRRATLDPSGLVKGWSVDRAAAIARRAPAARTTRSTRAATCASAAAPSPSRAGASASSTRPSRDAVAAVVEADDLAVATSGAYERGDARRRPAHRQTAGGCALGDDHRPRPRRPPTPTRRQRSRWAATAPPGRRGSARLRGD